MLKLSNLLLLAILFTFLCSNIAQELVPRSENLHSLCGDRASNYKVVCYFSSWSYYRKGDGKFEISDIDPNLCTHVIYAFAKLHNNRIESRDPRLDLEGPGNIDGYKKFNDLKKRNPNLKTVLAIGGWNAGSETFSRMASDTINRTIFVESVVPFLQKYGFDGLDIDWEYPGSNGGRPEDKRNFVILLRELKANLNAQGLMLTAAVPKRKSAIDAGYDIPALSKELDLINLMTYNFHGFWKNETGMNAPLYADEDAEDAEKQLTVDFAVSYWLEGGAPKEKLVMGLGLRAKSFTLANPEYHGVRAVTTGPGLGGPWSRQPGSMGFNEICVNLTRNSWNSVYDSDARAPYAYKENQWVSYDDQNSFNIKIDYVMEKGLAGVMLWAIDTDDFRGECYGKKWYLLSTVANKLL